MEPIHQQQLDLVHRDMIERLAGSWSKEEAKEFDKALQDMRKIDLELWLEMDSDRSE